jgi:hypothetical protein
MCLLFAGNAFSVSSSDNNDESQEIILPDFHCLVNYPNFLTKSRNETNTCSSGKRNCVMCGKLRICSAATTTTATNNNNNNNKGRYGHTGGATEEDTSHIIPRQNKGLCTACDVTVWIFVSQNNVQIKWCKGCKNFRPWIAFGDKGSATKCVRCRDRQREKYALQRDEMRSRRNHDPINNNNKKKKKNDDHHDDDKLSESVASQGLHSLLSAASTV